MTESVDDIVKEFIDFVNRQVGAYMDALAGFAGHKARVTRQIHRVQRKSGQKIGKDGMPITVWASYEDPSKPDVIHNQILRAKDYVKINSEGGSNEQQYSQSIIVFLFTFWEDEYRPRLAKAKNVELKEITSDIMGDLRVLRNVILHSKGVIRADKYKALKLTKEMFTVDENIVFSYEKMHKFFVLIKQECGRMMIDYLGVENKGVSPEDIVDIAIQKRK